MSTQAKIIAILLSVIALGIAVLGYGHYQYTKGVKVTTTTYEAAIEKQKGEAAQLLEAETAKVLARERELADLKAKQEQQDAQHQKTIIDLQARLRAAAGPAGRLRDPNAPGCGGGGGGAIGAPAADPGSRPSDGAEAGGLLSAQLSGLLQRLTFEADAINVAYASCRSTLTAERLPPN